MLRISKEKYRWDMSVVSPGCHQYHGTRVQGECKLLGSDVDTSYLGEIQGIEPLVLVPALSGTRPCGPRAYQPAPSQSPAGPSRFDWPCDGFYCTILRYLICNALVFILVEISLHDSPRPHPPPYRQPLRPCFSSFTVVSLASRSLVRFLWFPL